MLFDLVFEGGGVCSLAKKGHGDAALRPAVVKIENLGLQSI